MTIWYWTILRNFFWGSGGWGENSFWFILAQRILGVFLYLYTSCLLSRDADKCVSTSLRLIFRSVERNTKNYRIFLKRLKL
jgi:hypothetical protein